MRRYIPRVELLEGRTLLTADIAPPVLPVMSPAMEATESSSAQIAQVAVEHGESGSVLRLALPIPGEPQIVAIMGGGAAWVGDDGTAWLPIPPGASELDLVVADALFGEPQLLLHIEFAGDGSIARIEQTSSDTAGLHDQANMQIMANLVQSLGSLPPGGTASGGANVSSTSTQAHHGQSGGMAMTTSAPGSPASGPSASSNPAIDAVHTHAGLFAGAPAMVGLIPTGSGGGIPFATDGATTHQMGNGHGAGQPMFMTALSTGTASMPEGEHDSDPESDSVDTLFADWNGGEGAYFADLPAAVVAATATATAIASHVPSADDALVELPALPLAADLKLADTPIAADSPADVNLPWQSTSALAIAALTASGAAVLERRAQKARRKHRLEPSQGSEPDARIPEVTRLTKAAG